MKNLPTIAASLLGLLFLVFGFNHFFSFLTIPPAPPAPDKAELAGKFFSSMAGSGYLDFVKVLEIAGGLLVLIPVTRNFGLLILGPIVINILAVNYYIKGVDSLFAWPVIAISVLSFYLLIVEGKKFLSLAK